MEITVAIILVLHIIIPSIEGTYEGYVPIQTVYLSEDNFDGAFFAKIVNN